MDYKLAIRSMLDKAGISAYRASLDLGKSSRYISMVLQAHGIKLSTLQEIASICGYHVTLDSDDGDDSITLDRDSIDRG